MNAKIYFISMGGIFLMVWIVVIVAVSIGSSKDDRLYDASAERRGLHPSNDQSSVNKDEFRQKVQSFYENFQEKNRVAVKEFERAVDEKIQEYKSKVPNVAEEVYSVPEMSRYFYMVHYEGESKENAAERIVSPKIDRIFFENGNLRDFLKKELSVLSGKIEANRNDFISESKVYVREVGLDYEPREQRRPSVSLKDYIIDRSSVGFREMAASEGARVFVGVSLLWVELFKKSLDKAKLVSKTNVVTTVIYEGVNLLISEVSPKLERQFAKKMNAEVDRFRSKELGIPDSSEGLMGRIRKATKDFSWGHRNAVLRQF